MPLVLKVYLYLFQFDNTVGPAVLSLKGGSQGFPLAHICMTLHYFQGTNKNKKTFVTHCESLVHSCDAYLTVLSLHPLATIVKLINQSVCCTVVTQ